MSAVQFQDPERAQKNLEALRECFGGELPPSMTLLLRQAPDPDAGLSFLERYCQLDEQTCRAISESPTQLDAAMAVFAQSRYFSETLLRRPRLLEWATAPERFDQVISAAELRSEIGWINPHADEERAALILAAFKRAHLLRIALRDLLGVAQLGEVVYELSNLADALIQAGHDFLRDKLKSRFGIPLISLESGALEDRFVVLALGKLGGGELNYSSDIDLMYLHTGSGQTTGPVHLANSEFYGQLGAGLTKLLSRMTPEGFCYRVDLRLRPEGSAGELVVPLQSAVSYYHKRGRDWELQMLIKARAAAGHRRLGRSFLQMIRPLIYRTTTDFTVIEKVAESRDRIQQDLKRRSGKKIDVKLMRGGIRDIEFLVQCMQRLYGGGDPFVRSGGTLFALHRLREKNYVTLPDYSRLTTAYSYLRNLEHRLQMEDNRQTHELPEDEAGLRLLERKVNGVSYTGAAPGDLRRQVKLYAARVAEIYDRVIRSQQPETSPAETPLMSSRHSWQSQFRHLRRKSPELEAVLDSLEIDRGARLFGRFLDKLVVAPELIEELNQRPALLSCVADVMEWSPYFGEHLVRYPGDIRELREVVDAEDSASSPVDHHPEAKELLDSPGTVNDKAMELRRLYRRWVLKIQADSIHCGRPVFETLDRSSRLAAWVIRAAYRLAVEELSGSRAAPEVPLQVVALGRLGMREFDLGSDADLVFVLPDAGEPDRVWWKQCAERIIDIISSYTREGRMFSVDARLRPSGRDGELVQTETSFRTYFSKQAEAWEALSYLKARTVAGNLETGKRFLGELQEIAWKRFGLDEGAAKLLGAMRRRIEKDQGRKNPLKSGSGGYYDIDFILLYQRLKSAGIFFEYLTTPQRIDIARTLGNMSEEDCDYLLKAAVFFRSLDHGMRITAGKSSGQAPAAANQQEVLGELLRRWSAIQPMSQPLPAVVEDVRKETRAIYERVFGVTQG